MTSLAATERSALCDLALALGPAAPTLCEGWQVRDLVAHLVLRDGRLGAVGIAVPPLAPLADRQMTRLLERHGFAGLVDRLRRGPRALSPFRVPVIDRKFNSMEYFIHHEDMRRAQEGWAPRRLDARVQDALWRGVGSSGRALLRRAGVGVVAARSDASATLTVKDGPEPVTVHGEPAEIALYVHGRKAHAEVELRGPDSSIAALEQARLGI